MTRPCPEPSRETGAAARWLDQPVAVRAPATSANLGPGFDGLALALARHGVAVARVTSAGLDIGVAGEGSAMPHHDAAADSARSALLVAALTQSPAVLLDATVDYLHQRYRAGVLPQAAELLGRLRAAGVPAVLSGAGPSVLVFTLAGGEVGPDLVDSIAAETGTVWRISPLDVDLDGATLQTAQPGERP